MEAPHNTLVIDCLIFKNSKAFGYQEYLFNLLNYFYEHIAEFNYKKIIIACPSSQTKFFSKYADRMNVMGFKAETKTQHLLCQQTLESKLHLSKDDAVLFTYNYSPFFKLCKHVLVVHDLLYLRKEYLPNRAMRIQRKLYIPHSVKSADKIVAISTFTKNDICNAFSVDKEKIEVIYNYFNFEKYEEQGEDESCQLTNEELSKKYILSICSGAFHKNTISVLKAFEKVAKDNKEINLYFVGGITDKNSENFVFYNSLPEDAKKRIKFYHHISNYKLGLLYKNARLFISATLFEGLGMPIVEALYFNVPTLLSNLAVCHEVAGENANYFEPQNIEDIYKKIQNALSVEQKKETRSYILEKFSEKQTSAKYIELLNRI